MDGIPVGIFDEVRIDCFSDYRVFLPEGLPLEFTSGELGKMARIPVQRAGTLLNVLLETGVVERVGKRGNSFLYRAKHSPTLA
jgi:Fic family protein